MLQNILTTTVCKILDYGKQAFERKKRDKEGRKKQKRTQVKEIKFRPGTEEGDYQVKLRNLTRFLEQGDKAKVTVRFRGREMAYRDAGREKFNTIIAGVVEHGAQVESVAKMMGNRIITILAPLKK